MVRAWNEAGIEPVLYKGFALAEFQYGVPGTRFYSDVDVLVAPNQFEQALLIGRSLGWECPGGFRHWAWRPRDPHERTLRKTGAHAVFDVHKRLVLTVLPWTARERGLTQQAYDHSTVLNWQGVRVRQLSLADAFIFGMVISRCWGGDNWALNPHDYLDAKVLIARGLTREQLYERANQLNVARTVGNFLKRCNPFDQLLNLQPPTGSQILALEMQSVTEHVPLMLGNLLTGTQRAALALAHLPQILPLYLEVRQALERHPDLTEALSQLETSGRKWGQNAVDVIFFWWWAKRLRASGSLIWPVMSYIALRRRGLGPVFHKGERAGQTRAWVEIEGKELPEFYIDLHWAKTFRVTYERS